MILAIDMFNYSVAYLSIKNQNSGLFNYNFTLHNFQINYIDNNTARLDKLNKMLKI